MIKLRRKKRGLAWSSDSLKIFEADGKVIMGLSRHFLWRFQVMMMMFSFVWEVSWMAWKVFCFSYPVTIFPGNFFIIIESFSLSLSSLPFRRKNETSTVYSRSQGFFSPVWEKCAVFDKDCLVYFTLHTIVIGFFLPVSFLLLSVAKKRRTGKERGSWFSSKHEPRFTFLFLLVSSCFVSRRKQ